MNKFIFTFLLFLTVTIFFGQSYQESNLNEENLNIKNNTTRIDEGKSFENKNIPIFQNTMSKVASLPSEEIKNELKSENSKIVQTLDIDHFWEAFDSLKTSKTHADSVHAFQTIYLDRATAGLLDFIRLRQLTAEEFVNAVARFPKFYNSVRLNTYKVHKAVPLVEEIVTKFKEIYPNFKPKKVCFAIGLVNTGGTVSEDFLLIGAEVATSTSDIDLSEFDNSAYSKMLASESDIVLKIKNIVAHEYVHTQQKTTPDKNAVDCNLLYKCLQEGFCDFIGELISGSQINIVAHEYGNQHEKELWQAFKDELCNSSTKNWLYNYSTVKGKPADLGYYIGYKIAEEYYKNAVDKMQAVTDIIEMDDPIRFLQLSKYDQKEKK